MTVGYDSWAQGLDIEDEGEESSASPEGDIPSLIWEGVYEEELTPEVASEFWTWFSEKEPALAEAIDAVVQAHMSGDRELALEAVESFQNTPQESEDLSEFDADQRSTFEDAIMVAVAALEAPEEVTEDELLLMKVQAMISARSLPEEEEDEESEMEDEESDEEIEEEMPE